jgi:tRNA nucleotidyltransferase (CCA-adding enzyme)
VSECERILVEQGEGCIPVVANYDEPRRQWRMEGLVTRATILKTHEYYRRNRLRSRNGGGLLAERDGDKAAPKVTVNPEVFFDSEMLGLAENTKTVPEADDSVADAGA